MKNWQGFRKAVSCFTLSLFVIGFLGCDSLSEADNIPKDSEIDPFPTPIGQKWIPFEYDTLFYSYRYVDYSGVQSHSIPYLSHDIILQENDIYKYSFEDTSRGLLLFWREKGDSTGIYSVGSFNNGEFFYQDTLSWIPHRPEKFGSWNFGEYKMEFVPEDSIFYSEKLFNETNKGFSTSPLWKYPVGTFKETRGDTASFYHFQRGVGMMGFERYSEGVLTAAGVIREVGR